MKTIALNDQYPFEIEPSSITTKLAAFEDTRGEMTLVLSDGKTTPDIEDWEAARSSCETRVAFGYASLIGDKPHQNEWHCRIIPTVKKTAEEMSELRENIIGQVRNCLKGARLVRKETSQDIETHQRPFSWEDESDLFSADVDEEETDELDFDTAPSQPIEQTVSMRKPTAPELPKNTRIQSVITGENFHVIRG